MPTEQIVRLDELDEFQWTSITTTIDTATGGVLNRDIIFDDGTRKQEFFENGALREIFQSDNFDQFGQPLPGGGARPWEAIITRYDPNTGAIGGKTTIFDDGTQTEQFFQNGVLVETVQTDNFNPFNGPNFDPPADGGARPWESIVTTYDPNTGEIDRKTTVFDDGRETVQLFENGVLRETVQTDGFGEFTQPPLDGGAKEWESIVTRYDADGDIESRSIIRDDGVQTQQLYDDGVLLETLLTDGYGAGEQPPVDGGNFEWRGKLTIYDADGNTTARGTVFDDNDQIIFNYEGAQIVERLRIDGDGDEDWLLSVTTYPDTGPETVNYETRADVPFEYLTYLGLTPA